MTTLQSDEAALLLLGKKAINYQGRRIIHIAFDDPLLTTSGLSGCREICPFYLGRCTNFPTIRAHISCGGGYFMSASKYLKVSYDRSGTRRNDQA